MPAVHAFRQVEANELVDTPRRSIPRRVVVRALALLLLLLGGWEVGAAAYVHAKAHLAQHLLAVAWQRTRAGESAVRAWPGADTWPVARLVVPRLAVERLVLADAAPRSLAFGPGHLSGTALPGAAGNSVLAGHRDTHFAFLRDLVPGDDVLVEAASGPPRPFRVVAARVTHADDATVAAEHDGPRLTLVTCWPFDAVRPGTPWRYVVIARPRA